MEGAREEAGLSQSPVKPPLQLSGDALKAIFDTLFAAYGPQHWWPANSRFEVMIGAVLTQNTAWTNVERAISALAQADALHPDAIIDLPLERLGALIRPSGYFNQKARRLKALSLWFRENGEFAIMDGFSTPDLRSALLSVHGVGAETADDILLYAFDRPVFVIDTYTRRAVSRWFGIGDHAPYEVYRQAFERALMSLPVALCPDPVGLFGEFHALIVRNAKTACAKRPRCANCVLAARCAFGKTARSGDASTVQTQSKIQKESNQ